MKAAMFYHSFVSCWNHGNAHFLRGVARELINRGHAVTVFEPENGWSRLNALTEEGGEAALDEAARLVPGVELNLYRETEIDLEEAIGDSDLVIVHEWTDPTIVGELGQMRARGARFTLLFHDTHHRAISAPEQIDALRLEGYDAVLAFGEMLSDAYRKRGWGRAVFTWHEAADTELFRPLPSSGNGCALVWIGNWGDEERSAELQQYLIEPVARLGLHAETYGVRYPPHAREALRRAGIRHREWLPNHCVPDVLASAKVTTHIPRNPYTSALTGIPTIRMFETLACGIPLVCSPWEDTEHLFPKDSYLVAGDPDEMTALLKSVIADRELATTLRRKSVAAIHERHSCAHRVDQLLEIVRTVRSEPRPAPSFATAYTEAV